MNKKDMILALIEHYSDGNKAQFANLLGITPQGLSTWIKRETFDIELIFSKCEGLSANWLLTGKGSMIKGNDAALPKAIHTTNSTDGIPLIPFSAMAGALTDERTALEYECERYVVPAFKGADFLMPIKGTSMQPTYNSGDIVACQRVPMTSIFFQWNKPYVLDTAQGPLVKRVKPGSDQNHITLVSDNPDYEPYEFTREQFHGIALVRGLVRIE